MTTLQTPANGQIPEPLAAATANKATVRQPENARFLYFVHPERWQLLAGKLVPVLVKKHLELAVDLVDARGNPRGMIAAMQERGYTLVPEDIDGPGTSYVRRHVVGYRVDPKTGTQYPMHHHTDQFELVHAGSTHVTEGGDAYATWCASLIGRVIQPPAAYVIDRLIGEATRDLGRAQDRVHASPSLRVDIARLEATIATLRAALAPAPAKGANRG